MCAPTPPGVGVALDVRTRHGCVALATFAPYERRFLAERTWAGIAARRAAGLHVGRRRAVPQAIVERIVAERQAGASLYTIARSSNADGISGSHGGRWYLHGALRAHERRRQQRQPSP